MKLLYDELADWWPLVSATSDYAEESAAYLAVLAECGVLGGRLLELGAGNGHIASYLRPHFQSITLTDRSPAMLRHAAALNPDCACRRGDMRSVRLGAAFDVVFAHDALDYLVTRADLTASIATIRAHCAAGGVALLAPDHVRESYSPGTAAGEGGDDARRFRYLEWTYPAAASQDTRIIGEYVYLCQERDEPTRVVHERNEFGLFARDVWVECLHAAGFTVRWHLDAWERTCFVARLPAGA